MSLVEDAQELIVVSELEGRKVTLHLADFVTTEGVLHSISVNGVFIKSESGDYEFYPWHQVNCMSHEVDKPVKNTEETQEKEIEIIDSPKTLISETLSEGYEWDWEDEDETIALIEDSDGDEVIKLDIETKEIEVYYDKDLGTAKVLARKFNISKITRDYKE